MILNQNIGILGHVDCGKTSLARALSQISSTAAFDKSPQSQKRGITLDLGFSAYQCPLPDRLLSPLFSTDVSTYKTLQLTFVDCPGHAKLIRTIIGGAQIIDIMLLVIDITKGIQTQTAECLVLGEICAKPLVIVLSKVDKIESTKRGRLIDKYVQKLRQNLGETIQQIIPVSSTSNYNLDELLIQLCTLAKLPPDRRNQSLLPFLFAVDHCFLIRGKGTICTGTVLQGHVACNDTVEILSNCSRIGLRKVKSIQMFRQPLVAAEQGDRVGLCFTQFDSDSIERGLIATPEYAQKMSMAIVNVNKIKYFKETIVSNEKFHIHIGYETVMAKITIFSLAAVEITFDWDKEYEFLPELLIYDDCNDGENRRGGVFALLKFERPVMVTPNSLVIASKLDANINAKNNCRLAFWGHLQATKGDTPLDLSNLRVFKRKSKEGVVQRVISATEIVVDRMFKKESNRQMYVGLQVSLSTGELGIIQSTFGATSKVKVLILGSGLAAETMEKLIVGRKNDIIVLLRFKKFLYVNTNYKLNQIEQ